MRMAISVFLLFSAWSQGATYYIDLDSGVDSNAGTSSGAPWKTIPGTRNTADSADQSTSWGGGTISSSSKVQAGDTLRIKSGTMHNSTDGGKILIGSTYYVTTATLANPITVLRDTGWGSGSTTFDGTGFTMGGGGFGLLHVTVAGVKVDGGSSTNGFILQNSPNCGLSAYPSGDIEGPSVYSCFLSNNGTLYNVSETADASMNILRCHGGEILNCYFDGHGKWFQGITFGESHKSSFAYTVSNCVAWDFRGIDDAGIAFKAFNSQVDFVNCYAARCFKGWDLGEFNGDNSNMVYKVVGCEAYSCTNGINFNGDPANSSSNRFYVINSVIHNCSTAGSQIYASPFDVFVIGCVYDNNGGAEFGTGNLGITINYDLSCVGPLINAHIYNTILYKPSASAASGANFFVQYYSTNVLYSLDSDYNCWIQRSTEDAAWWNPLSSSCYVAANNTTYAYGANGPGQSSGNWYSWYSYNTTAPYNGTTGHFHSDSHSKGTGSAVDSSSPVFDSNYRLTTGYLGTDISGKSWYTAEMGKDKDGVTRTRWDMGAFEFIPPASVTNYPALRWSRLRR